MISYAYKITNADGESFTINDHTTDPKNFIALQSYPQFDVDVKNAEVDKEGQHGIWDFFSYYGRRVVSFQGVIIGESEADVELLKNKMMKVLSLPLQPSSLRGGLATLEWTDSNSEDWQITECKLFRPISFERPLKRNYLLNFSFSVKSATPFIVSQTQISVAGTRGWVTTGGEFPLKMPATLGITQNNDLLIKNQGMVDAHTVIRIYGESEGAITNPRIKNLTTGKTLFLNSTIADETGWIEIDSDAGTVVDEEGNDLSGEITGASEFVTLRSGENSLLYESDEDPITTMYEPSAPFTVKYRKTKI